jgi:hypothetical protein
MTMVKLAGMIAICMVACGGKQPAPTTPAVETEAPVASEGENEMVPPEKMDEIERLLARKQGIMSRCLASAVDSKELPTRARGKLTLEIVISESGKANDVQVIRTSLESPKLQTCVVDAVKAIQFPELPRSYPTSYTYAFEAL